MKVSSLFRVESAKSKSNEDYDNGSTPYITSTTLNNGVLKLVEPFSDDKVFAGGSICVSGLGYASLQMRRFLPKGNGGDSCTILIPKKHMSPIELIYYTAVFNKMHTWRFSFGRKGNKSRIEELELPAFSSYKGSFSKSLEDKTKVISESLAEIKAAITK